MEVMMMQSDFNNIPPAASGPSFVRMLITIGMLATQASLLAVDLTGSVNDPQGNPLPGASVFISTAAPKEGTGVLCPSCYADCRKWTRTDESGHFKIEGLDSSLKFRVLFVAKDCKPRFMGYLDPAEKPVEVKLKEARADGGPKRRMKGRVVGADGSPLAGAVVEIRGVQRGSSTRYGGNDDVDEIAVSDAEGLFVIRGDKDFDAVGVDVRARGYAKGIFKPLSSGDEVHELKLNGGVTVKGRLLKEGGPVAGVQMGISGADRSAETYVGDFTVATDEKGRFAFTNLPPAVDYVLCGKMGSLKARGAVPARHVTTMEGGPVFDAGDIELERGFELSGRIRLADGKPVPQNTRILLSRDEAWDSEQIVADAEGRFKFTNVPPESVELYVRPKGYRLSFRNKSLDPNSATRLIGLVKADKTDMEIELEPGDPARLRSAVFVEMEREPLRGAEAAAASTGDFHVTGTVVDADTGKPIKVFTVTEGRITRPDDAPQWIGTRVTKGSDGKIEVYLSKGKGAPALLFVAPGYLPHPSDSITGVETTLSIALKSGRGAEGVVLKADGKLFPKANIGLVSTGASVSIRDRGVNLDRRSFYGGPIATTDENGRFAFEPNVDDYAVVVMEEEGFALVRVEALRANPEIKLQAWARIEGQLRVGGKAGPNETVRLMAAFVPYQYRPHTRNPIDLYLDATTDEQGRFVFERVPPIGLQVSHSPNVRDSTLGVIPASQTTSFELAPGEVKKITLGGKGRPVTGRVVLNGYAGKFNWRMDAYHLELVLPPASGMADMRALNQDQMRRYRAAETDDAKKRMAEQFQKERDEAQAQDQAFYQTKEGREYAFRSRRRYVLDFAQDGSFRVEDVPGGRYLLRLDLLSGEGDYVSRMSQPHIAMLEKEFEIPESPGGRSDEAFDLGTIEVEARRILKAGSTAPEIAFSTVDGRNMKLSDFAGKYVLIDFWAVWCGPCVAETPNLKETYAAFKDDPRFRMIGLSLDPDARTPGDYAKKNELGWVMGFLGEWSKTNVPNQYGVYGIPSILLVGPDGKVVDTNLRGSKIKEAVQRALSGAAPATAP